ncbi:hypothetical protein [Microbacterium sp. CIAB417]|uniref:hypothetical protein n=1 Tax=Microbacterium sp. CIAB417 TaxID=2860287 RepID=UPI001FAC9E3B|nr:hypothetical protein [Microbacterium sp. CIAB417]
MHPSLPPESYELGAGVVTRTLFATPRTRTEEFFLRVDDPPGHGAVHAGRSGGLVLGTFAVCGPRHGSWLLWEGTLAPAASLDDALSFFEGNLSVARETVVVDVDVSHEELLVEDEFWPVIDLLERRAWENTLPRAVAAIASNGERFALRWANTAAQKALELAPLIDRAGVPANLVLGYIGAVITQGRAEYQATLTAEGDLSAVRVSDHSSSVLSLGAFAYDRLQQKPDVFTRFRDVFTSKADEIRRRSDEDVARYQRDNDIHPARRRRWWTGRAIVQVDDRFYERVVFAEMTAMPGSVEAYTEEIRVAAESFGGRVAIGPEVLDHGIGSVFSVEAYEIKRRSSVPVDRYIEQYVTSAAVTG